MTADKFRALSLALPGATESAHQGHPDFRLAGKIFATLGYPDAEHGMVKLTPAQQSGFVNQSPGVFRPSAGAWGRNGSTLVRLAPARVAEVRAALATAGRGLIGPAGKTH